MVWVVVVVVVEAINRHSVQGISTQTYTSASPSAAHDRFKQVTAQSIAHRPAVSTSPPQSSRTCTELPKVVNAQDHPHTPRLHNIRKRSSSRGDSCNDMSRSGGILHEAI